MSEFTERLLAGPHRKESPERVRLIWMLVIPLIAILFQVYVPRFVPFLGYLDLPLLVTIHFALAARGPIPAVFYGMFIGLVQDS
ncbi:MAG TPA: rod shape-determining protein MreD, partial [Bryobacteraceae bacterium]|nr:rod shape-determining protein MreD [Bryobacteraceae bacterium]